MVSVGKAIVAMVGVVVVVAGLGCERPKDKPGAAPTSRATSVPAAASGAASQATSVPATGMASAAGAPVVRFMGVESRGRRVIFVCDASGSMLGKFDDIRVAVRRAVEAMEESQSFNVLFLSGNEEPNYRALGKAPMRVSKETQRITVEFVEGFAPYGKPNPIAALRAAFAQGPDVIYLLTNGDYPDNQKVLDEITRLNKDKAVRVNAIGFIDRGDEYEQLLERIARENGGTYRFVTELNVDD